MLTGLEHGKRMKMLADTMEKGNDNQRVIAPF
jgi:hypothetical protein